MSTDRKPLDSAAYSWMVLLTALWGFQQVTIKVIAADVSLVAQAAIRSLAAGVLFGVEFVFIYGGLAYTNASRMVVFIYLAPVFTALGLHLWIPGERLNSGQWLGVLVAFSGVALAFFNTGTSTLVGDLCGVSPGCSGRRRRC